MESAYILFNGRIAGWDMLFVLIRTGMRIRIRIRGGRGGCVMFVRRGYYRDGRARNEGRIRGRGGCWGLCLFVGRCTPPPISTELWTHPNAHTDTQKQDTSSTQTTPSQSPRPGPFPTSSLHPHPLHLSPHYLPHPHGQQTFGH